MYEPEERSRSLSKFLVPLGAIVVAAAIIAAAVFGLGLLDGGGDSPSTVQAEASPTAVPTPTQPGANPAELAIGEYVRNTLAASYGGDCSVAVVNQQAAGGPSAASGAGATGAGGAAAPTSAPGGNVLCSQSRGERKDMQAYVLGKPLQEPNYWVFVKQNGGSFTVISAPEITPEMAAVPGTPWPFVQGADVVVVGGDCLNVREGPSLDQAAVDCIPDGTTITLATGPVDADGYQWWQVDGRSGWVVSEYLRYPDAQ